MLLGLGATGGPLIIGTAFTLGLSWRSGYFAIGCVQLGLAAVFLLALPLWKQAGARPKKKTGDQLEKPLQNGSSDTGGARQRLFAASACGALFYYVYPGIELVAGLWAASYLIEKAGAPPAAAAASIALYWASLTFGRFFTGIVASRVSNRNIIRAGIGLAALGALLLLPAGLGGLPPFMPEAAVSGNLLSLCQVGLLLVGLGLAPLYPTMMHDTPARVGNQAADRLVGLQVGAALAGSASIPALTGLLAAKASLAVFAPVLLLFLLLALAAHEGSLRFSSLRP